MMDRLSTTSNLYAALVLHERKCQMSIFHDRRPFHCPPPGVRKVIHMTHTPRGHEMTHDDDTHPAKGQMGMAAVKQGGINRHTSSTCVL